MTPQAITALTPDSSMMPRPMPPRNDRILKYRPHLYGLFPGLRRWKRRLRTSATTIGTIDTPIRMPISPKATRSAPIVSPKLAARLAFFQVPDRLGDLTQAVTSVDNRFHLSSLHEIAQDS